MVIVFFIQNLWISVLTCLNLIPVLIKVKVFENSISGRSPDISKIQDNLSDIRSGNLEKLSNGKKICLTEKKTKMPPHIPHRH
jgi:hypothetical protein